MDDTDKEDKSDEDFEDEGVNNQADDDAKKATMRSTTMAMSTLSMTVTSTSTILAENNAKTRAKTKRLLLLRLTRPRHWTATRSSRTMVAFRSDLLAGTFVTISSAFRDSG